MYGKTSTGVKRWAWRSGGDVGAVPGDGEGGCWLPEQRHASFAEPLQQAFVDRDCPDGLMGKLHSQTL